MPIIYLNMKKFFHLLILLLFCTSYLSASASDEHLQFLGLPIAGSYESFSKQLEDKGFVKFDEFESSYKFIGKFANEIVELTILASPRTKTVCKVIVYFPEKKSWTDLKEDYFKKKRLYRSKYLLTDDYEFFSSPYEDGDGYEFRAVKVDKCKYISFFKEIGGHISVEIDPKCRVKVTYEDDINIKIGQKELETNAFNDI